MIKKLKYETIQIPQRLRLIYGEINDFFYLIM